MCHNTVRIWPIILLYYSSVISKTPIVHLTYLVTKLQLQILTCALLMGMEYEEMDGVKSPCNQHKTSDISRKQRDATLL